jgi:hypothetical protein
MLFGWVAEEMEAQYKSMYQFKIKYYNNENYLIVINKSLNDLNQL